MVESNRNAMEKVMNRFKSRGIYPYNYDIFDDDFAPSGVTELMQESAYFDVGEPMTGMNIDVYRFSQSS